MRKKELELIDQLLILFYALIFILKDYKNRSNYKWIKIKKLDDMFINKRIDLWV